MATMEYRLGWTPGTPDPRTLHLDTYTTPDLPAPPTRTDWMNQITAWPMLGNDRIGDCVLVTCAHLIQGWTRYASGTEVLIPERDVIDAYARITGYNPQTGDGDNGTLTLPALNFWRKTGVGGHRITAFVKVDHHNDVAVRQAANLFGGLFIAAQLPRTAQTQHEEGRTWTPSRGAAGRRGSWGGHALRMGGYGKTGFTVSTWGRTQKASWGFWDSYVAEAWAVLSVDWFNEASKQSPTGFDLAQLVVDLKRVAT